MQLKWLAQHGKWDLHSGTPGSCRRWCSEADALMSESGYESALEVYLLGGPGRLQSFVFVQRRGPFCFSDASLRELGDRVVYAQ